jgi:hypothetical protein
LSAPGNATVLVTGINLMLAVLLLAAIIWRGGSRKALGLLIVGAIAGFALTVVSGLMSGGETISPDNTQNKISGIESGISDLRKQINDIKESIQKQNIRRDEFNEKIANLERDLHQEITMTNNFVNQIVLINDLKTDKPPPSAEAKITIGSMSIAPDPDRRHKGKRVLYLTLRTVGGSPAAVTSADISFCPGGASQSPPANCTPAGENSTCPPRNFLCAGYSIGSGGQPSARRYATIPDNYVQQRKPFRVLVKLIGCSAGSAQCDGDFTSIALEPRFGAVQSGDLVSHPEKPEHPA